MKFNQREHKKLTWYLEDDDFCCKDLEGWIKNPGKKNTIQVDWENGYILAVGELNAVVLKYCPFCGEKIGRTKKHVLRSPGKHLEGTIDF